MATWAHHKENADLEKLRKNIQGGPVWVHRPLIIHERNTTGKKCGCGCNSLYAIEVERRELADVLIDPATGVRRTRQKVKPEHLATWDRLAKDARKIYLPHRVSRAQLAALDCKAKILACFGGVRGGKTHHLGEVILTEILLNGGFQAQFWWVAPTLPKTQIGLNKLALGDTIGKGKAKRFVKPLLPPELISYVPKSTRSDNLFIELIDGSKIFFKYASDDGGNLKGESPSFIGMDEGCEVRHRSNYQQCVERLMEGGGQLLISTTPKAGHYLKEDVYDKGVQVDQWKEGDEIAWCHLVAWDNPWVSEDDIRRTIKTFKDDPQRIKREVEGQWVGSGPLLWRHFDEMVHLVNDDDCWGPKDLGLVDITTDTIQNFFLGQRPRRFLGQDFNLHPMCAVELRVAYHPADPKKTPILVIPDEVVRKVGTIFEHMETLKARGYSNAGISCDATGAQFNPYRLNHGVRDMNSHQAKEMNNEGFICQPCRIGSSGKPSNPGQAEKVNPLHKLMRERIELPDGSKYPRFLIHKRAAKTLISLRVQEADSRGNPLKEPNTVSDRISGPTDAVCYGVFPIEHALFPDEKSGVYLE